MKKIAIGILSLIFIVAFIGCATVSEMLIPTEISRQSVQYVIDGMLVNEDFYLGYHNLALAEKHAKLIVQTYKQNTHQIQQLADDNLIEYQIATDTVNASIAQARELEQTVFGPEGALTMLAGIAGFGGIGTLLGKYAMRKPGDWSPEEVQEELGDLGMQINDRERQVMEIVKGTQKYLEDNQDNAEGLKGYLASAQSEDTKQLVAKIKAVL